ncbi:sodium- and chloride-dependent glycine transporter 2-like [Haliotis rubra]|uniref:sodium- and chloride-dependent glycine transporter 2-like n=1 Tax=Haliotis rubra TaxID=36100 RepID=UPI001EE53CCC|nr:sodium- and chloride-dependent glycine transporter 2-like [Haliotis rubra]
MFQLVDWYVFSLGPMVICTLECIAVSWIYGMRRISQDVEMMIGKPLPMPVKILRALVTPVILLITFILTLLRYQPPTYGTVYVLPCGLMMNGVLQIPEASKITG